MKKNDLFIKYQSKYCIIDKILIDLYVKTKTVYIKKKNFNTYKSFSTGVEFADFITSNFVLNKKDFSFNVVKSNNTPKFYIINKEDKGKIRELNNLGVFSRQGFIGKNGRLIKF
jgi:hypothetical protein